MLLQLIEISTDLVNFNAVLLPNTKPVDKKRPDISFDSNSLEFSDNISVLDFTQGSEFSWNYQIMSAAKAPVCIGLAFSSRPDAILRLINLVF